MSNCGILGSKKLSLLQLFFFLFIALGNSSPCSATSSTFKARATLALCGDYRLGGVSVELMYRIGSESSYRPIAISSQSINSETNTGSFEFELPSIYQSTPLAVAAFCRSPLGLGAPSAEAIISNCDALAARDTDGDGLNDRQEDTNCDNFFSPGDLSNLENVDTDGDGVRDLVETTSKTDPTNPGSSPRPYIFSGAVFDPDSNGNSNPVAFRPRSGEWFVKDFISIGNALSFQFGTTGDIPFTYQPKGSSSDVGVIRRDGNDYVWLFRGPGFSLSNGGKINTLKFGLFGDNIILGPWEEPGVTSPAVARLYNNTWFFDIYLKDGTIRHQAWGGNGDVPFASDYDGDGLFDVAVFRPSQQKTFVISSSNSSISTYKFGTGTADFTVRGDYTGDGVADITFWESQTGLFSTLTSNNGFNDIQGLNKNSAFYKEESLGLYFLHLPMNYNRKNSKILYTVVNHSTGERFYRENNNSSLPITVESWGTSGDALG